MGLQNESVCCAHSITWSRLQVKGEMKEWIMLDLESAPSCNMERDEYGGGLQMRQNEVFSIKETSEQAGLSEDTIRYYEKIGLLPRAERKANRHRVYRPEDIHTMRLITCLKKRECLWKR